MVRFFFYAILVASVQSLQSQSVLPDSLVKKFDQLPKDSAYVNELNIVGAKYLRSRPEITRALASRAIELASKLHYVKGYARALTVMGNAYWYEGMFEFAQNYYLMAARQYKSIADTVGLGYVYNNIGEVYKKLNDYDKALEYLLQAKALKETDTTSQALTLYNIAEAYLQKNDFKAAEEYLDQSLTLALYSNNDRVIAFNFWGIAALDKKAKNFDKALNSYRKAETIWIKLGEIRSLVQTYQQMADVYREQRDYPQAELYLNKAIQLASQINVPDLQVNNYLKFSSLDSVRGNYKGALYFYRRYALLKDSVYNFLKAEQIARLETIYETELKEEENRKLRSGQALRDEQLKSQRLVITIVSVGLVLTGVLAWFLFRQRKKILFQKEAIELQAGALLQLNKDLNELNKHLEARIDSRTKQIIQQNKKITEYTFINAHKLRGPVASILGLINLLPQVTPEEREAILQHIKTCGEQLDAVIHEVSKNLEGSIVPEK